MIAITALDPGFIHCVIRFDSVVNLPFPEEHKLWPAFYTPAILFKFKGVMVLLALNAVMPGGTKGGTKR